MCVIMLDLLSLYLPRNLASGSLPMPSRERKWTNMAGLKYHLTTNQKYVRNYVFDQARKMVMKQTSGLYPAPFKIMEVNFAVLRLITVRCVVLQFIGPTCTLNVANFDNHTQPSICTWS